MVLDAKTLLQLSPPRILVFGDLMLDRYTRGNADRISPEAPVIILDVQQEEIKPGGAASTAYLLRKLGADVAIAGVVGQDSAGQVLLTLLQEESICTRAVFLTETRRTTIKHRFIGQTDNRYLGQLLRVDYETRRPIVTALEERFCTELLPQLCHWDAILISDYLKGVCTPSLLRRIIETAKTYGIPVLIDPGRLTDYSRYRGATLLKPNRAEMREVVKQGWTSRKALVLHARQLCQQLDVQYLLVTLDSEGMIAVTDTETASATVLEREVYDITGAGDMVLAAAGFGLTSKMSLQQIVEFASIAASLKIERCGAAPVTREEILIAAGCDKVVTREQAAQLAKYYKGVEKKIVLVSGCFDLLHAGHIQHLEEAAKLGDILFVAVNSDASVRRLKGAGRPIVSEQNRLSLLSALNCVTHVVLFTEDSPQQLLQQLQPEIFAKGGTTEVILEQAIVTQYGGQVCRTSRYQQLSTTSIIADIQNTSNAEVPVT